MRARVGHRLIEGVYGWERLDVRSIFRGPPASDYCGFGISLELPPGISRVALEVHLADGGWQEFARRHYTVPWLAAAQGLGRKLPLGWARAVGSAQAYRGLRDEDLEFRFGHMEQTGGHPLRLSGHHPPRPIQAEALPRSRRPASALPKLTLVTPSFQQRAFLAATLSSVEEQRGVTIDHIVEDGGSTDGTVDLLRAHGAKLKRWRSEPDAGQADALRRGFAEVECRPDDIMGYLNSDDLLMPDAAQFVADYFARHPAVDVVFGHRVLIDEAGAEVGRWYTPRTVIDDLHWLDLIPQETMFWRKRLWDRVGGIDPAFQFALDWDLLLRFQAAGARFARLPWFLGQFRLHPGQKSQARLVEIGIPEMDALRRRALGRVPEPAELRWRTLRAQEESCRSRDRLKQGWRW